MKVLDDFLDNIADAIRKRKQITGVIEAKDFASEIESIPQTVKSDLQAKSVTITSNGTTTVTPDSGYDGMESTTITTNVQPKLQAKTATLTTTSSTVISPDSGYYGLSKVTVAPATQTKSTTITSNGTTTIKPDSGKVGLTSVSVTTNIARGGANAVAICSFSQSYASGGDSSGTFTIPAGYKYATVVISYTTQGGTFSPTVTASSNCSVGGAVSRHNISTNYSGAFNVIGGTYTYLVTVSNTSSQAKVSVTLKGTEGRQAFAVGIY